MAAQEGEERLLILFADVHYYFQAPTPRPLSHRFDKGSYFYLYRNRDRGGGRVEVANNVGKPEQDAFTGLLESATIRQSHKQPTLCTITVDGFDSQRTEPAQNKDHHWRLPNTDPRNEGKFLFRLHTLDIYFWKAEDATAFMSSVNGFLQQGQVEILDAPPAPAPQEVVTSPIVQKLESVAIQDPAYQNGRTRNSQSTIQPSVPKPNPDTSQASRRDTPKTEEPAAFKPMAYNPAAPPAPEPIQHREKTPPPPESEHGTGLAAAAHRDHAQDFSPLPSPLPAPPQGPLSRPPYGQSPLSQGHIGSPSDHNYANSTQPGGYAGHSQLHLSPYASPPPSSAPFSPPSSTMPGQRTPSVSSIPPPPQSGRTSVSPYATTSAMGSPPPHRSSVSSQHRPQAMSFGAPPKDPNVQPYGAIDKPLTTPTSDLLGNSYVSGTHQPLQHLQPQYADYLSSRRQSEQQQPVGGYANYDYTQQPQNHGHSAHDIHNQIYRPTENEAQGSKPHRTSDASRTSKVDKGVNRFLKKLEKNFG